MFNFSIVLDNVGLNIDTYFGSLALPLHTILAVVFVVVVLRVRKVVLDKLSRRNAITAPPQVDLQNSGNDFDFDFA